MIDEFSYDQEKVSKFIGKSRSYITNSLRLLNLPAEVLKLIDEKISTGHAKILVGLDNAFFIANKIIENSSVRQAESFVNFSKRGSVKKFLDPNIKNLEENISDKIDYQSLLRTIKGIKER